MSKKVLACIDLNNKSIELLKNNLKEWDWQNIEEVHFVHGFQIQTYSDLFYLNSYPAEDQFDAIENSVKGVLKVLEDEVLDINKDVSIFTKCLIANSPKEILVEYAQERQIDIMVIGTRGKHGVAGLFSSSFAEYMVKHAPCELKIIREI